MKISLKKKDAVFLWLTPDKIKVNVNFRSHLDIL